MSGAVVDVTILAPPPPDPAPPPAPVPTLAGDRMLSYLPTGIYGRSTIMRAILGALGGEIDELLALQQLAHDQFFVRRANEIGLDAWEDELGLVPNLSLTLSERQDRAVAHLRGYGTATIAVIKSVVGGYVYGEVEVDDESTDPSLADYTVRVTFIDETGIPSNLTDLQAASRAVVPAHLAITYVFNWTTWDEIDVVDAGAPRSWDSWDVANAGLPYTWDQMETLV